MFTSTILFGMKLYLINRIQYSLPYNENRAEQGRKVELRGSIQKPGQPTSLITGGTSHDIQPPTK